MTKSIKMTIGQHYGKGDVGYMLVNEVKGSMIISKGQEKRLQRLAISGSCCYLTDETGKQYSVFRCESLEFDCYELQAN